jgi:RNA polymerase sigma-70 factor, ECF subfamily
MQQLIEAVLTGKKGAATKFYMALNPSVRRYISGKVGSGGAVEELVQDTFLSAFDSLITFRGQSSLKTWILSIARHEVADYYRKRYVRKLVEQTGVLWEGVGESASTPELELAKKELSEKFDKAMGKLSTRYRKVLEMRYLRGMSVKEIAEQMSLPFKATESVLYRSRMAFVEAYHEE